MKLPRVSIVSLVVPVFAFFLHRIKSSSRKLPATAVEDVKEDRAVEAEEEPVSIEANDANGELSVVPRGFPVQIFGQQEVPFFLEDHNVQDSLGRNSKTIIIANMSPSNCCALETLSILKFTQCAKLIKNNAIMNEYAFGDVLGMCLQIQQLKDSLGRNSKTITIANMSPSNCCALETFSTLKFTQCAQLIKNNAIMNEYAFGDVLGMCLQIQQLKDSLGRNSKTITIANMSPSNCCALETFSTLKFTQCAQLFKNNAIMNEYAFGDVLGMCLQIQQLKDSLGRNSKTITIANMSPSNCYALETLSTLKFTQCAKLIKNNAIMNEYAFGDVLGMCLQIQQLKKEVNRLHSCLILVGDSRSPSFFKWDARLGSSSPLTFDKRISQDSLGRNSKTIIIANMSPSNCCALETLSTLKFTQRAKLIKNNAIMNEDAFGDVLGMCLQIQQLKDSLGRNSKTITIANMSPSNCCALETLSTLKFTQCAKLIKNNAIMNEYAFGDVLGMCLQIQQLKRKEYEAALAAAFRRDHDKEAALKAMAVGKQAAEQLATQRTEEVRSLKMRLWFHEEGIKRLEAIASGKLSPKTHLLQEREELLKEIEILHNQVDHNPEVTRFAMENLQLKEELRRLQSFAEEGEREIMNEQITVLQEKLLEALDWKFMHEKDPDVAQDLSLSWDSSANEENEFLRLQAIQNQKEIEALRKNLAFYLEANEKLERRVEELVSQLEEERKSACDPNKDTQHSQIKDSMVSGANDLSHDQVELKTLVDAIAAASQREAESHEIAIMLTKETEELHMKHKVLIEDNNTLMELFEGAVSECSANQAGNAPKINNSENQVDCLADFNEDSHDNLSHDNYEPEPKDVEHLEHQLLKMHEENEKLMGLYKRAMHETDEFKRRLSIYEFNNSGSKEETNHPEKLAEVDEERVYKNQGKDNLEEHAMHAEVSEEKLHLVRGKLELVEDKLATTGKAVQFFGLLEDASTEVVELLENIGATDHDVQQKQQEITVLKHALSQLQEQKISVNNKFLALQFALNSYCSQVQYWEEREAQARARVDACSAHLEQKKEELRLLKVHKDEISTAYIKARHSESELRSNIDFLKLKLQNVESRRKETEKILFAVYNINKSDLSTRRGRDFRKASKSLKSEEDRTKLSAEMKLLREQLAAVQMEIAKSIKKSEALDAKIQNLEKGIKSGWLSLQKSEHGLQQVVTVKEALLEAMEDERTELGILLVEYQECIFELDLKEEEVKLSEEAVQQDLSRREDLRAKLSVAAQNLNQLLQDGRCMTLSNSEECLQCVSIAQKVERELGHGQMSVTEAKSLLLSSNE